LLIEIRQNGVSTKSESFNAHVMIWRGLLLVYDGTFKVNVQFYMDSGKKDSKGHTLLDDIGEIKSNKRITIYRKADGSWRSY